MNAWLWMYPVKQSLNFLWNTKGNAMVLNCGFFGKSETIQVSDQMVLCAVWCHLCNFKSVKNNHGRVLPLVQLQAEACNFTETKTPPWMFFLFLNCINGTRLHKLSQIIAFTGVVDFVLNEDRLQFIFNFISLFLISMQVNFKLDK